MLHVLTDLVEAMGSVLPPGCELVLHDLSRVPTTIHAISGDLTGRPVGAPPTDRLLKMVAGSERSAVYDTALPDGRLIKAMTTLIHDSSGNRIAALCVNIDVSALVTARAAIDALVGLGAPAVPAPPPPVRPAETFVRDVDDLGQILLSSAIEKTGVPVELMHKRHKKAVVSELQANGFFTLRESVETAATALGVSRYTIYNYLTELREEGSVDVPASS